MRIALLILAAALLFFGARWLYGPAEQAAERRPAHPAVAGAPSQPAPSTAPAHPAPATAPYGTSSVISTAPNDSARSPVPHPPGAPSQAAAGAPNDATAARMSVGLPGSAPAAAEPPPKRAATEPPERERGKLTLQGSFTYKPQGNPPPAGRARVTVAGTLDCKEGRGSLYYRDPTQRIEWQSSEFSFDANAICVTEPENLDALVTGFNASISGAYSPLTLDVYSEPMEGGQFGLRLVSTDAAGVALPYVLLCLSLQHGSYAEYALPQNASNPSKAPGCTFLDNFSVLRSK